MKRFRIVEATYKKADGSTEVVYYPQERVFGIWCALSTQFGVFANGTSRIEDATEAILMKQKLTTVSRSSRVLSMSEWVK